MTKKPKKPRDNKNGDLLIDEDCGVYVLSVCDNEGQAHEFGYEWADSTKEIEDLHRWLGDCIRYIKYRQRKKK